MTNQIIELTGSGYELTITEAAEESKRDLIVASSHINQVTSNDESGDASYYVRQLAQVRIAVEKSKKEIKAPILEISKRIEEVSKNYLFELEEEEQRIKKLISDYSLEVARKKSEAMKVEASIYENNASQQQKFKASTAVAELKTPQGVRFIFDFQVQSIDLVWKKSPEFVTATIKRSMVLAWLKELEQQGLTDEEIIVLANGIGITVCKIPVVSTV